MSGAITVVTPSPAVDVTYRCASPRWGEVNRVDQVSRRAGGKGLNVASVLHQLGRTVRVTGFLGGPAGDEVRALCPADMFDHDWVDIAGSTRSTMAIHGDRDTTLFNEPGPVVHAHDWRRLVDRVLSRTAPSDVVVVSGSCPPGTNESDLVNLLAALREAQAITIVDTSGDFLLAAAPHADLLKPNREELAEATGLTDLHAAAHDLLERGAGAVAVSAGPQGMDVFLHGRNSVWNAAPAAHVQGNPTGAGDAAVAAFADGLHRTSQREGLPQAVVNSLANAVALSGAAVLAPVAGVVDMKAHKSFLDRIEVQENHAPRQPA